VRAAQYSVGVGTTADGRRRRVPWWAWTLAAIAVVIGVVAALGGFADVPITRVRTIALGSTFHGQQVDSRVLGARVVAKAPGGSVSKKGAWLELDLESTDRTDAPVPVDAVSLRTIVGPIGAGSGPDATLLSRGGSPAELQPGIPTRLAVLWQVRTGAIRDGDRIVVGLFQQVPLTGRTVVVGQYGPPEVQARLQFTVGRAA
jgi:hypothetical protein